MQEFGRSRSEDGSAERGCGKRRLNPRPRTPASGLKPKCVPTKWGRDRRRRICGGIDVLVDKQAGSRAVVARGGRAWILVGWPWVL